MLALKYLLLYASFISIGTFFCTYYSLPAGPANCFAILYYFIGYFVGCYDI